MKKSVIKSEKGPVLEVEENMGNLLQVCSIVTVCFKASRSINQNENVLAQRMFLFYLSINNVLN